MRRATMIATALLCAFWLVVIPLLFVTLYSVLEYQEAARVINAGNPRLANPRTMAVLRELDRAETSGKRTDQLLSAGRKSLIQLFEDRERVRTHAIDILSSRNVADATSLCMASREELNKCQIKHQNEECTADWIRISDCYQKANQLTAGDASAAAQRKDLRTAMKDAVEQGFKYKSLVADYQDSKSLENDPMLPVAESLRTSRLPFIDQLFILPQGVIVASFTGLMAALGAGVASLVAYNALPSGNPGNAVSLLRSFAISPLLGALAGFLVYFVVSAGASFLVQPSTATATAAVNNLSVPALASLGVFAGLAANNAISWLQKKAANFFQS